MIILKNNKLKENQNQVKHKWQKYYIHIFVYMEEQLQKKLKNSYNKITIQIINHIFIRWAKHLQQLLIDIN